MKFLLKLALLPLMLLIELWGALLVIVGIFEMRIKLFFTDDVFDEGYYEDTTAHKVIFTIPLLIVTLLEIAILVPIYICHRVVNTIMEVIPLIMLPFSFAFGFLLGLFVMIFNHGQYYMLDASKRSQCAPVDFTEIHPTAVMTAKMSGQPSPVM